MKLSELTWQEIDELDRSTVVVVPFGAMEQHGLHLPMCTDSLIGDSLASRLDTACCHRLLILPTQWLGLSTHHMRFPGTITVSPETFIAMAFDILSSMAKARFRKFLILNSHGGNISALDVVATKCKASFPDNTFLTVTYWNPAASDIAELRSSPLGGMGHACELETSLVMSERPSLVRREKLAPDGAWPVSDYLAKDMTKSGKTSLATTFDEISATGTVGDPTTASAEKGERFFQLIVHHLVVLTKSLDTGDISRLMPVGH
jgi:creatinine amidohydrolase